MVKSTSPFAAAGTFWSGTTVTSLILVASPRSACAIGPAITLARVTSAPVISPVKGSSAL